MSADIPKTSIDHLEFYLENDISPVRQNIDDLPKHLQRRSSLYQRLGLPSILFQNNVYKVIDNNSTNGIILNGRKIQEAELHNADIIEIADVSFTFYK